MAIVATFEFPDADIGQYDQVLQHEPRAQDQPKRQYHVCYELPGGGFGVLDVWESEEALGEFAQVLGPATEKAGLGPPAPKVYPVHHTM